MALPVNSRRSGSTHLDSPSLFSSLFFFSPSLFPISPFSSSLSCFVFSVLLLIWSSMTLRLPSDPSAPEALVWSAFPAPTTYDEWRAAVSEVKSLNHSQQYKQCVSRCKQLIDTATGPVRIHISSIRHTTNWFLPRSNGSMKLLFTIMPRCHMFQCLRQLMSTRQPRSHF